MNNKATDAEGCTKTADGRSADASASSAFFPERTKIVYLHRGMLVALRGRTLQHSGALR